MKPGEAVPSLINEPTFKITYGGWYQRTTLHLSEIYEFFSNGNTYLDLDKNKLQSLKSDLQITSVERKLGNLEYVEAQTELGISIKYYEDGLYLLSEQTTNVPESRKKLDEYFNQKLNPSINYLFSLGAPTPKMLANIKTSHPAVVTFITQDSRVNAPIWLDKVYSTISSGEIIVSKSSEYILIQLDRNLQTVSDDVVEMQIFFREFKDQLEKYLNIHRKIWQEIEKIRLNKELKIKDLPDIRNKLDTYQKTVSLISNRINQMGAYARTRKAIAQLVGIDKQLVSLFQYRFEVLLDTLDYIKEIWKMTTDYVNSAVQVLVEAQAVANTRSIQSLTLITSIGVIAGLINHLARDSYPKVTWLGSGYLVALLIAGWLMNKIVQSIVENKKQNLKFKDTDKDI